MPKPRSSTNKYVREGRKREREARKREKAELKRRRREDGVSAPEPPTHDVVPGTEADAVGSGDQDVAPSPPENLESRCSGDVGVESCTE